MSCSSCLWSWAVLKIHTKLYNFNLTILQPNRMGLTSSPQNIYVRLNSAHVVCLNYLWIEWKENFVHWKKYEKWWKSYFLSWTSPLLFLSSSAVKRASKQEIYAIRKKKGKWKNRVTICCWSSSMLFMSCPFGSPLAYSWMIKCWKIFSDIGKKTVLLSPKSFFSSSGSAVTERVPVFRCFDGGALLSLGEECVYTRTSNNNNIKTFHRDERNPPLFRREGG